MVALKDHGSGPGRRAPARLLLAAALLASPVQLFAQPPRGPAQPQTQAQAQAQPVPVPDQLTALKMLWSMMAAVDHANRTGNYSVLRDMGSAVFQANNNPANLATIFSGLRERGVDLSNTLVVTPVWEVPPTMIAPTALRMRGTFPLRPLPIQFDMVFLWDRGWRLDAISIGAAPPH
jgi:hypothetical protein